MCLQMRPYFLGKITKLFKKYIWILQAVYLLQWL